MQRFHFPTLNNQELLVIQNNTDIYHQLTKVLRIKTWDEIIFFDWNNLFDYTYKVESIEKKSITLKLINKIQKSAQKTLEINLYQSIPNKQEKIELILQKWVEVWYSSFYFFKSERSQNLKISENKIDRFKKILIEATEQSVRNIVPELHFSDKIDFKNIKWTNIYFHTDKNKAKKLKELNIKNWKANIFIWPEWGFSDNEITTFDQIGFTKVNLWDSILRTETAGIVVWFYLLENI
jgi:16S rRNA (uracil1498-N3)-methyltransferase